jgi:hypothetical protein
LTERDRGYPEGMCSQSCDRLCPDRTGEPTTFCVSLGDGAYCLSRVDEGRYPGTGCRAGYHRERRNRNASSQVTAEVCLPDVAPPDDGRDLTATFSGEGTPLTIPDAPSAGVRSVAQVSNVAACELEVGLDLSIRHTYRGDLVVGLTDPAGERRVIHDRAGGGSDDLVLSGMALTSTTLGSRGVEGTWALDVSDRASLDVGVLESWRLTFTCRP